MYTPLTNGIGGLITIMPPALVLMLVDQLNRCVANVQRGYAVALTDRDQVVLEYLMTQYAEAHNFTVLTQGQCDFGHASIETVSVEFCGDTNNDAFNGGLIAESIRGSVNSTLLLEFMTSATNRDCGLDPVQAGLLRIGIFMGFLTMLIVGACCYEGSRRLRTLPRPYTDVDHQPSLFRTSTLPPCGPQPVTGPMQVPRS